MGHQSSDSDQPGGSEEKRQPHIKRQARAELISKLAVTGVWMEVQGQAHLVQKKRKVGQKREKERGRHPA